ncbi:MAG: hypothetical protein GWP08_05425 [Nitrospiraceae bacterium]|nr:hypothetical protein [Nitrospiraceae bacterium]
MRKKSLVTVKTYVKNLILHAHRLAQRTERPSEAFARIKIDSRKLKNALVASPHQTKNHRRAVHLVKRGRSHYNKQIYDVAADYFHDAIEQDNSYGLAHVYLGHALHKMGRREEAMAAWRRTVTVDPHSDAGHKAQRLLDKSKRGLVDTVAQLEEMTRRP